MRQIIKIGYIMSRNFKMLIRSKLSALIFFFGPLIVLLLVCLAFNTSSLYDLNIAVYSEEYSPLSESLISALNESGYKTMKVNSSEACDETVRFEDYQGCIIFPKLMALDNSANNRVIIRVDNTRLNIANLLASQIVSAVSLESSELSTEMVNKILVVLDTVNQNAIQSRSSLDTLKTGNSEIGSSANVISGSLDLINLDYTAVDASAIDTEISNIQSNYNLSSSAFSNLNSLVDTLQSAYSSLTSNTDSAKNEIVKAKSEANSILSLSSQNSEKIDSLHSKIDTMASDIGTIKVTNVENIVIPIKTQIEGLSAKTSYLLFIWPFLLALLIMFSNLLLSSTMIISEKTSKAYFRNFITPTADSLFVIGNFLSLFVLGLLQIALILVIGHIFLGGLAGSTNPLFILVLFLLSALFISLGMCLGYLFRTKQTVVLAALSLGIILLFFSDIILPLEVLAEGLRSVANYNPFVLGHHLLKSLLIFDARFVKIAAKFYMLLGFVGFSLVLLLCIEKAIRRRCS
ncbi:ABC transporter permease [archaeon]|nr:ABC transporter permease [archaeon]